MTHVIDFYRIDTPRALDVVMSRVPSSPWLRWKAWDYLKRLKKSEPDTRPCDTNPPEDAT